MRVFEGAGERKCFEQDIRESRFGMEIGYLERESCGIRMIFP